MPKLPKPPEAFDGFIRRFPKLGQAWEALSRAGNDGPLTERDARLVKLGIAIGAMREGAVRSNVRKGRAEGVVPEEMEQVIALAASTIGLPSAVAVFSWYRSVIEKIST